VVDANTRTLKRQQDEYQRIGTPEQQEAYRTYNAIRFGGLAAPVTMAGQQVGEHQLRAMSPDERSAIADAWGQSEGIAGDIEQVRTEREEYRASHPEYAAYYDWSTRVRDYEGGPRAYWDALIGNNENPNARRWYEETLNEPMMAGDLDQRLTSVNAYIAQQGMRPSGYDPAPIATRNDEAVPYDPSMTGGTGSGDGQQWESVPAKGIAQDIADYYAESAAINQQLGQLFGQPGLTWEMIERENPTVRNAVMDHLRTAGIEPPYLTRRAQGYIEWQAAQPPGTDTSINAYLRWQEQFSTSIPQVPDNAGNMTLDELLQLVGT
jgi:hypothetical protein